MTPPRYIAWRFLHPGSDGPEAGLRVSAQGQIDTAEGRRSVRQAILLLLATVPGERVMRPGYGCHLHRLVFAPNDDTTAGLAMHYVRRALEQWEPRVELLDLDAGPHPSDPARLDITLAYRIRSTRQADELTFSLNLTGEAF